MKGKFLRVELHCHTTYSLDGLIRYDSMMRTAIRRGIEAIAVTDHDTIDGALEFCARARRTGPPVHIIIGEERTLSDNSHVIGLFLAEPLTSSTFSDVTVEIREQRGICVIPHPFRRHTGLLYNNPSADVSQCCFEVFNAKSSFGDDAAARSIFGHGATAIGGSDAHVESDLGTAINLFRLAGDIESTVRAGLSGMEEPVVLGAKKVHSNSKAGQVFRNSAWHIYDTLHSLAPGICACTYRAARNVVHYKSPELRPKTRTAAMFTADAPHAHFTADRRRSSLPDHQAPVIKSAT